MTRTYRWARRAVWGTLAVVMTIGCNPLATIAFLTHKDTPVPAEVPAHQQGRAEEGRRKRSSSRCSSARGPGRASSSPGPRRPSPRRWPGRSPSSRRRTSRRSRWCRPPRSNKFKMKNPNWKDMHASAWGKKLGADFVLEIHLDKMQPLPAGQLEPALRGPGRGDVTCTTSRKAPREPKSLRPPFSYPKTGLPRRDLDPDRHVPEGLPRTARGRIAQHHIDYKAEQRDRRGAVVEDSESVTSGQSKTIARPASVCGRRLLRFRVRPVSLIQSAMRPVLTHCH